jgi:hypothetical protein
MGNTALVPMTPLAMLKVLDNSEEEIVNFICVFLVSVNGKEIFV